MEKRGTASEQPTESPVAWFCVLERARLTNDFDTAARAIRELRRLGVEVRYRRGRKPREKREAERR